jgi:hypothetical protein
MTSTTLKFRPLPSIDTLRDHFRVVPIERIGIDSGLVWVKPTASCKDPGDLAGCLVSHSKQDRHDWKVVFNYKRYYVSRVIYAMYHGIDPGPLTVDHIDRNPLNNSIDNLELVDRAVQNRNRRLFRSNTSGARGVSWSEHCRCWTAQINSEGELVRLGNFDCKIQAAIAYNEALRCECEARYESTRNKIEHIRCGCDACTAGPFENTTPEADNA